MRWVSLARFKISTTISVAEPLTRCSFLSKKINGAMSSVTTVISCANARGTKQSKKPASKKENNFIRVVLSWYIDEFFMA